MAAPSVADRASRLTGAGRRVGALAVAARLAGVVVGGLLLYASFPPRTLWWLALPAFALLWLVVHGRRPRAGFGYGLVFGCAFFLPLLVWIAFPVGPLPWVAPAVLEALFVGATGAVVAAVSRLPGAPLWAAAAWVAGEAARGRVPFGGFPWGRAAFGQADGPLLPVAALGGAPLLSFVTVLAGLGLGELARRLARRELRAATVAALLAAVALLAGPVSALVPPTGSSSAGTEGSLAGPSINTSTIAAVQGNVPRLGLDFNAQRRAVLDNHVRVTEQLAADVAAGRVPQPDLVIWPENSSDIDPLRNPDAAAAIDRAARAVGVPILVGAVLRNPDGRTTSNAALVWSGGEGVIERTDKRRVQPFGEYLPWRGFFEAISPIASRASYFVPGPGAGVVDMAGTAVGVAICWEIAFDDLVADSVAAGAEVLAVPSNNATFGLTEMTHQQLAMSRVRAVEHDREVIVATTSGVSATIDRGGAVTGRTQQFTPDVLVTRSERSTTTTLATRLRSAPEWALVAMAGAAVVWTVVRSRRRRSPGREERDGR